jgi:hypothetical protein
LLERKINKSKKIPSEDTKLPFRDLLGKNWITIDMASVDVITIYRALTPNSQLILGL